MIDARASHLECWADQFATRLQLVSDHNRYSTTVTQAVPILSVFLP